MAIDEAKFSVDEREGEYRIVISVTAEIRETIKADSLEDARTQADKLLNSDDLGDYVYDVDDAEIVTVFKSKPMFRAWDGESKVQVSRLEDHHTPREPDERGF